ncbi:hypothetical protein KCP73_14565 [Salmonella enterica subsp. enterica]|nr:hypothetical protein KCP73_14565 [Salmonella enterica subsp. enterica]
MKIRFIDFATRRCSARLSLGSCRVGVTIPIWCSLVLTLLPTIVREPLLIVTGLLYWPCLPVTVSGVLLNIRRSAVTVSLSHRLVHKSRRCRYALLITLPILVR